MPKYGRGLNREVVAAVNTGTMPDQFSVSDVRSMVSRKKWCPEPTENYINCCLGNGSSDTYSLTYKKYFRSVGDGMYIVRDEYKGVQWV